MARFLALDWDHQQLHLVAANLRGGSVQIQGAVLWPEPRSPNPAEAAQLGQLLKQRLHEAGIAPAPVLACVGRDRVILKELRFPTVPAAEEPAVVRFQALKEITEPANEVIIDYVPVGQAVGGERRALALIVRKELLTAYQTMCQAAGLKLAGLTPRPFGIVASWRKQAGGSVLTPAPEPPGAPVALLVVGERWAEFCIVQGDSLLLARALTVGATLPGEVKRNLAVYAGQATRQPIAAVYLAADAGRAELRDRLHEMLRLPVHTFDPLADGDRPEVGNGHRAGFAGPMGLLLAQAESGKQPINFLQPRQPKVETNAPRRRLVLAAVAAGVLVVGLCGFAYAQFALLDSRIANLAAEKRKLDTQLTQLDQEERKIKALQEWTDNEVVWLDELYDLTDRVPNHSALQIRQLTAEALTRTANNKHVARLTLKGVGADHVAVNSFLEELVKADHYRVGPAPPTANRGIERNRFSQAFTAPIELQKVPPEKFTRKLPPPPKREEPNAADPANAVPGDFGMPGFGGGN